MCEIVDPDLFLATEILAKRCPFNQLKPGEEMPHCPLGFPGCSCADEWMVNPHLTKIIDDSFAEYLAAEATKETSPGS